MYVSTKQRFFFTGQSDDDSDAIEAIGYMEKYFGKEWFHPKELFMRPHFILEKLIIAEKYRVDVELIQ